jgi:capsule polysaccharide export protein KpsE/RkpR
VFKCEEQLLNNQKVKNLLTSGSNRKSDEVGKVTRGAILDLHKKTDYQGELINEIGKDLIETNKNLDHITVEIKKQGEQIVNVHANVNGIIGSVKRADKTIGVMTRREICHKILLHILAVLLFAAIVICYIIKKTS